MDSPLLTVYGAIESQGAVGDMTETDELRRLRREVAHLKLENDILKKAAVILGTNPQPRTAR
jgi:transposase-like protein